jgi:fructose-bisphosphate aldolase class II
MPLVSSAEILKQARQHGYGIPSLLAGNLEMLIGPIKAAEELGAPLIFAFNQAVTPQVPLELGVTLMVTAARQARVPVATILDHGQDLEQVVRAIHAGSSSVMFDGSLLPYEENIRQTREVVRVAHAVGVCVEAEVGSIGGSALEVGLSADNPGPDGEAAFTSPAAAVDFVERTGIDVLAISFGNAHGVYAGEPRLDLDRVRKIKARVPVPLVMHGASGLAEPMYREIVASGISKVCYYTAMGRGASHDLEQMMLERNPDTLVYHHHISRAIDYFYKATQELLQLLGCAGAVK